LLRAGQAGPLLSDPDGISGRATTPRRGAGPRRAAQNPPTSW